MITQPSYYYNKVGFYSSSSGKIYLGIYPSDENTWNTIIQYFTNAQIEEGSVQTSYEPYMPVISQIYLDEPLRKIGTSVDYIDFKNSKVIRNVEAIDETGTLPISNGLQPLIPPTEETITLPDIIPISINGNMITGTNITGTLDITYIKDTNKVINNLESRITLLE